MADEQQFTVTISSRELDGIVKHIDRKNLEARNCTLDSVRLVQMNLPTEGMSEESLKRVQDLFESTIQDLKHHFTHNRDNIIQVVELVLRGGKIRRFDDGS